jgi:hypothetical protein
MTANVGVLRRIFTVEAREAKSLSVVAAEVGEAGWNQARFCEEQIRSLVRRVFVPGWPRPARQVVFSAVDNSIDVSELCVRTAETLAAEGAERVCLVETDFGHGRLEQRYGRTSNDGDVKFEATGAVRVFSRQIRKRLWLVDACAFLGERGNIHNLPLLRSRLGQLRREFDYAVIHAPPVENSEPVALLAHVADGLVLSVEAHRTRRVNAIRIRDRLLAANVRLLGVVLQERTFPIPERLYRRL